MKSVADYTTKYGSIDEFTLKAEISSGEEVATAGDTVTVAVRITDDSPIGFTYIYINRPS